MKVEALGGILAPGVDTNEELKIFRRDPKDFISLLVEDQQDENGMASRTTIVCSNGQINVNRSLLILFSQLCKDHFALTNTTKKSVIHMIDYDIDDVKSVVSCLYSGFAVFPKDRGNFVQEIFEVLMIDQEYSFCRANVDELTSSVTLSWKSKGPTSPTPFVIPIPCSSSSISIIPLNPDAQVKVENSNPSDMEVDQENIEMENVFPHLIVVTAVPSTEPNSTSSNLVSHPADIPMEAEANISNLKRSQAQENSTTPNKRMKSAQIAIVPAQENNKEETLSEVSNASTSSQFGGERHSKNNSKEIFKCFICKEEFKNIMSLSLHLTGKNQNMKTKCRSALKNNFALKTKKCKVCETFFLDYTFYEFIEHVEKCVKEREEKDSKALFEKYKLKPCSVVLNKLSQKDFQHYYFYKIKGVESAKEIPTTYVSREFSIPENRKEREKTNKQPTKRKNTKWINKNAKSKLKAENPSKKSERTKLTKVVPKEIKKVPENSNGNDDKKVGKVNEAVKVKSKEAKPSQPISNEVKEQMNKIAKVVTPRLVINSPQLNSPRKRGRPRKSETPTQTPEISSEGESASSKAVEGFSSPSMRVFPLVKDPSKKDGDEVKRISNSNGKVHKRKNKVQPYSKLSHSKTSKRKMREAKERQKLSSSFSSSTVSGSSSSGTQNTPTMKKRGRPKGSGLKINSNNKTDDEISVITIQSSSEASSKTKSPRKTNPTIKLSWRTTRATKSPEKTILRTNLPEKGSPKTKLSEKINPTTKSPEKSSATANSSGKDTTRNSAENTTPAKKSPEKTDSTRKSPENAAPAKNSPESTTPAKKSPEKANSLETTNPMLAKLLVKTKATSKSDVKLVNSNANTNSPGKSNNSNGTTNASEKTNSMPEKSTPKESNKLKDPSPSNFATTNSPKIPIKEKPIALTARDKITEEIEDPLAISQAPNSQHIVSATGSQESKEDSLRQKLKLVVTGRLRWKQSESVESLNSQKAQTSQSPSTQPPSTTQPTETPVKEGTAKEVNSTSGQSTQNAQDEISKFEEIILKSDESPAYSVISRSHTTESKEPDEFETQPPIAITNVQNEIIIKHVESRAANFVPLPLHKVLVIKEDLNKISNNIDSTGPSNLVYAKITQREGNVVKIEKVQNPPNPVGEVQGVNSIPVSRAIGNNPSEFVQGASRPGQQRQQGSSGHENPSDPGRKKVDRQLHIEKLLQSVKNLRNLKLTPTEMTHVLTPEQKSILKKAHDLGMLKKFPPSGDAVRPESSAAAIDQAVERVELPGSSAQSTPDQIPAQPTSAKGPTEAEIRIDNFFAALNIYTSNVAVNRANSGSSTAGSSTAANNPIASGQIQVSEHQLPDDIFFDHLFDVIPSLEQENDVEIEKSGPFKCNQCDEIFEDKNNLNDHLCCLNY